jgi:hypothetical protein
MSISRRSFLSGAGAVVAIGAVPLKSMAARSQANAAASALGNLTHETFKPLIGSSFRVRDDADRQMVVTLAEVNELDRKVTGARHSFTLRFRQLEGGIMPQGTYRFSHSKTGDFALFVVPAAAMKNTTMTAVINRL